MTVPKPRLTMIRSIQASARFTAETNSATRIKPFAVVEGERRRGKGGRKGGRGGKKGRERYEISTDCYGTQLHGGLTVLPNVN